MRIIKKRIGNKEYFYLRHSYRNKNRVITKEKYIGKRTPKDPSNLINEFMKKIPRRLKQPIGYIKGEGTGPELIESALSIIKEIGKIKDVEFRLIEYRGEAPALKYTRKSYYQLKDFYNDIRKKKGCVIRGAIFARQVYKLRNDFNMTFKPVLINPIPELYENSPFKEIFSKKIDLLLIRENAQGLLMSKEKIIKNKGGRKFEGKFYYNEKLCERFVEMCYKEASKRKKKIMFIIKGDVWSRKSFGGLWLGLWERIGKKYPEVEFDWEHDDTWFGYFIAHPENYDMVVALGIAGDLITDPIATLAYGTRAVTPSANISPDGFMTFQTIHGAGTKIPKGKANPIGIIRAVGLLMDYFFKMPDIKMLIDASIRKILSKGYRTIDIHISNNPRHKLVGTKEMANLIIEEIRNSSNLK